MPRLGAALTAVSLIVFLPLLVLCNRINDTTYNKMPDLYGLENFDACQAQGPPHKYCVVQFRLYSLWPDNSTEVWRIIENMSANIRNFRHDLLERGVCLRYAYWNNATVIHDLEIRFNNEFRPDGIFVKVEQMFCNTFDDVQLDIYDVIACYILIGILLTVVMATGFDYNRGAKTENTRRTTSIATSVVLCFSLTQNWTRLRRITKSAEHRDFSFIQGVRFTCMTLVVFAHTCLTAFLGPIYNPAKWEQIYNNPLYLVALNGNLIIQIFFVISSFLLSYFFHRSMETRKFRVWTMLLTLLARYIRLTASYAVMILIQSTLLYRLGAGPYWEKIVGSERYNCRQVWWTNLLYINNYYEPDEPCIQQGWYLAAEMQLFTISLVVISLIWNFRKNTHLILAIAFLIGLCIPGYISYTYDLPIVMILHPMLLKKLVLTNEYYKLLYISSLASFGPYVIGLTVGYIFYRIKGNWKISNRKWVPVMWWALSFGIPISTLLTIVSFYYVDYSPTRGFTVIFAVLSKVTFAAGCAFAILGVCLKLPGSIGWVFRWHPLVILGRLSYCAYLVHVAWLKVLQGSFRTPFYYSFCTICVLTITNLSVTMLLALILCLCIEFPISALQKLLLKDLNKTSPVAVEPIESKPTDRPIV